MDDEGREGEVDKKGASRFKVLSEKRKRREEVKRKKKKDGRDKIEHWMEVK